MGWEYEDCRYSKGKNKDLGSVWTLGVEVFALKKVGKWAVTVDAVWWSVVFFGKSALKAVLHRPWSLAVSGVSCFSEISIKL